MSWTTVECRRVQKCSEQRCFSTDDYCTSKIPCEMPGCNRICCALCGAQCSCTDGNCALIACSECRTACDAPQCGYCGEFILCSNANHDCCVKQKQIVLAGASDRRKNFQLPPRLLRQYSVCKFFFMPGGCIHKQSCKFKHVMPD